MARSTRALYQPGIVTLIVMTAACSSSETGESGGSAPSEAGEMAGYASEGLPLLEERAASEQIPASFALGRAATNEEIARQDIHIMPDGRGLPEGSGNAAAGEELYKVRCAACHGNEGEGTPLGAALIASDPEVGFNRRVVGHFWPHATTAFDYIRRAMPWDAPGTLTSSEVYSVVAFILAENGVLSRDDVLDAESLKAIRMPALDRFVVDDRLTTNEVR